MLGMKLKHYMFMFLMSLSLLTGCGGSNSESGTEENGDVYLSFTDAEGDFINYTVDVLSVKLTRADGTEVETLPVNTRINFADYTEMTEFLTAATVPRGIYVKGSVLLDYSNADIWVEDASGAAQQVQQILDANGDPVSTLEVNVTLEGRSYLPIAPGIPKNLMLDFDLEKSHVVNLDDPISITVDPVFVADVDPVTPRRHRLRGPLKEVNVAENRFSLFIRPFYHRVRGGARIFGSMNVLTNDETVYEIDGITYQGSDGLSVLETMPIYSAVIAAGSVKFAPLRFEATEVYAGSSVPGGDLDVVRGTVTSRNADNQIVVKGATMFRNDGTIVFNDQVTVQLDGSTAVSKQLSMGPFTIDDISVGQRIIVFGVVTNDEVSDLQLSAANGYARMMISSVHGAVSALPDDANDLTLNLSSINGRNPAIYDFSGTGSLGNDADPLNYEIDHGSLSLDGVATDDNIIVRGFPVPFGAAPSDFTAQSVIQP